MCLDPCFSKFPYLNEYPVFIDGTNVANFRYNRQKRPQLLDILLVINYLIKFGFKRENIHCVCDPSLKYYINKPIDYQILINEKVIIEAPKVADEFILSFALKYDFCFIISNDRFRDYIEQLPSKQWLEERRISFMIINNLVCLSPNISYERLENNNKFPLTRMSPKSEITTLDIVNNIEKSDGELDLF